MSLTPFPICPRCDGYIPSNENPGAHIGARSRLDNATEICSRCGTEEAIEQLRNGFVTDWRQGDTFRVSIDTIVEIIEKLHVLAAGLAHGDGGMEDDCAAAIYFAADELRRILHKQERTGARLDQGWD